MKNLYRSIVMFVTLLKEGNLGKVRAASAAHHQRSASYAQVRAFFEGTGATPSGLTFADALARDDSWWDECHDFIQWMFPATIPSQFNPNAPVVTPGELILLGASFRPEFKAAYLRYLQFLGIQEGHDGELHNFNSSTALTIWRYQADHNDLRLTRVLAFLRGAMMDKEASALMNYLEKNFSQMPVKAESLKYWRSVFA